MYEVYVYISNKYRKAYSNPDTFLDSLSTEDIKDLMKDLPSDLMNKLLFCNHFLKICHQMAIHYPQFTMRCKLSNYAHIKIVFDDVSCIVEVDDEKLNMNFKEYLNHFVYYILDRYYKSFGIDLITEGTWDDFEKSISLNSYIYYDFESKFLKYFSENISELVNIEDIKFDSDMIKTITFNIDVEYLNLLLNEVLNDINIENRTKIYGYMAKYFNKITKELTEGYCL